MKAIVGNLLGYLQMKDRFRAIRKHFGLTQEQFGKRISKTTGFILTLEAGKSGLSQSTIGNL